MKERYQCKICDYQATQKGSLSTHVKNVHQKSENINCSKCNKSIQKMNLKRHLKMFHSGDRLCIIVRFAHFKVDIKVMSTNMLETFIRNCRK